MEKQEGVGMKKKVLIILLCLGICLGCTACSDTSVAAGPEETVAAGPEETVAAELKTSAAMEEKTLPEVPLVSRTYFLENCGYSEDDLVGVDIDEFITEYRVTEEYMKTEEFKKILLWSVEDAKEYNMYIGKYSYLWKTPLNRYEAGMLDDIKVFYIKDVYMGNTNIILFDFENSRVCKGPYLSYQRDTLPDDREKLLALISSSGIEKITETDQKKEIAAGQEWVNSYELVIETNDGRIAHLKGNNIEIPEYRALAGNNCRNVRDISERTGNE